MKALHNDHHLGANKETDKQMIVLHNDHPQEGNKVTNGETNKQTIKQNKTAHEQVNK